MGIRLEVNVAARLAPLAAISGPSALAAIPSSDLPIRRDFLYVATASAGAVGLATAIVPFIAQMNPDASTIAAAAPIDVDISLIVEGQIIKVFWRGKLVFISPVPAKRSKRAGAVDWRNLINPAPDAKRIKEGHEQWLVVIGICTHLGCIPLAHQGDYHGWFCPCHGSQYDIAGRVRRGPAPANLYLPPYEFPLPTAGYELGDAYAPGPAFSTSSKDPSVACDPFSHCCAGVSACMRFRAVFARAKWLNACGKLPSCRRVRGSYCSASKPTSFRMSSRRPKSSRASS